MLVTVRLSAIVVHLPIMDEAELIARGYDPDQVEWEMDEEERIRQGVAFNGPGFVNRVYRGGECRMHAYATSAYLIRLLLSYGANINQIDNNGCTPLMHCVISVHSNPRAIECLLDNGADPDLKDKHGNTAFVRVAAYEELDVVLLFLRRNIGGSLLSELPSGVWKHSYLFLFCVPLFVRRFHKSCWLPLDCVRLLSDYL